MIYIRRCCAGWPISCPQRDGFPLFKRFLLLTFLLFPVCLNLSFPSRKPPPLEKLPFVVIVKWTQYTQALHLRVSGFEKNWWLSDKIWKQERILDVEYLQSLHTTIFLTRYPLPTMKNSQRRQRYGPFQLAAGGVEKVSLYPQRRRWFWGKDRIPCGKARKSLLLFSFNCRYQWGSFTWDR